MKIQNHSATLTSSLRHMAIIMCLCAGFFATPASVSAAEFSSWANQMKIVFTGYTRSEPLEDFSVLVTFSNRPGFTYTQFLSGSNADLRFTDASLIHELNYEIEQWDTNGVSLVWVQVPKLAGTNTTLLAYWGKEHQVVPAYSTNGATWNSNYRGVWHLAEPVTAGASTGIHLDSSSNRFEGAQSGNSQADGVVGMAQNFNGSSKITMGAVMTMNAYTKEAWVKLAANGNLMSSGNSHAFWVPGGQLCSGHNNDWQAVMDPNPMPVGSWQHIAVTYDSATNSGQLILYRNGVPVSAAVNKAPPAPDPVFYLASHGGANFFTGQLDEARVSSVARSSNWIWASWMNQASNAFFETTSIVIPSISNCAPSDVTAISATLNGVLVSNRTAPVYVAVYWGTNDAGTAIGDWQYRSALEGEQAPGPLKIAITGLYSNQSYFFTYSSSNACGTTITQPSLQFNAWGSPSVDNDAATGIDETSVTLRGILLVGHGAYASFYWGGNPTNLTNVVSAGLVEEGVFSAPLTGHVDTCYYRSFVSNQYGVAWAASVTNISATLRQVLKLEQDAEFGKAFVLGTAFLARCQDTTTLGALRETLARLQQEKRAAVGLSFAIESLGTHRDIAEGELAKEPEVSVLLLRKVIRERDGTILINAASILSAMNDPVVPALIAQRLKTSKDQVVLTALQETLDQRALKQTGPTTHQEGV